MQIIALSDPYSSIQDAIILYGYMLFPDDQAKRNEFLGAHGAIEWIKRIRDTLTIEDTISMPCVHYDHLAFSFDYLIKNINELARRHTVGQRAAAPLYMGNILKNIVSSGVADVLGLFGVPTATADAIYAEILEKRKTQALDILLGELRQGNFQNVNQHELISIIARFQRDAMEGTAKNNLYLLARVIRGMGDKNELIAPCFSKYADALSSLTKDEIIIIGHMAAADGCFNEIKSDLLKMYTEDRCIMILQSLLRTGLIYFYQGVEAEYKEPSYKEAIHGKGIEVETNFWTNYSFTPVMEEILRYVDIVVADEEENIDAA